MGFLAAIPALAGSASGLGSIGTALTVAGAGIGAYSSLAQGAAARNTALYQAAVAKNNAEIMKRNADQALIAGTQEESAQRMRTTRLLATQLATQGASGVDVAGGSALAVREGDALTGEMDALTIRYNATRQAYGYNVEASNQLEAAKMYKRTAKNAMTEGILGAGQSLIGGATSLYGQKASLKAAGVGAKKLSQGNPELSGLTAELRLSGA